MARDGDGVRPRRRRSARERVLLALTGLTILVAVSAFGPRFADAYWALELPGHFRAQLTVAAGLLSLGFAIFGARKRLIGTACLTAIVATPVVQLWIPSAPRPPRGETLKVLSLNVSFYDRNHQDVIDLIRANRPDVIGLVEVSDRWVTELKALDPDYPHRAFDTTRRGGVGLLSQRPLETTDFRPFVSQRRTFALATLTLDAHPVTLAVVHTASPMWATRAALRNQQLALLAAVAREVPHHEMVLVGDFNTSPWSLPFQRLMNQTGWRTAADGFGFHPTWPAERLWAGIPIDHHLVSDGIVVHDFAVVGPTGSDHLAVYTEIGIRKTRGEAPGAEVEEDYP